MAGPIVSAGHLGGYVKGGDPATWYPELWEWLVAELKVGSVIDVGCGEGLVVEFFRGLGCNAVGVDGIPQVSSQVLPHDYTVGPKHFAYEADLVWCCEFVEHVEERHVPNFLATFKAAPLVLMTHAGPGQQGYHHVNCQTADYWRGVMAAIGYKLDMDLTVEARSHAASNKDPYNHFARSGVAFRRYDK